MVKESLYYIKENNYIKCKLCPNSCIIAKNSIGKCFGRKNINGKLFAVNYGEITALAIDPIEKKPLYHFLPGSDILSVGTFGCSFKCNFCQNWEISQKISDSRYIGPSELVETAEIKGCIPIAFTYSEPLIWYEYILDTMQIAMEKGIATVLVTNGYINIEPFKGIKNYISAMNIDLKSYSDDFYKRNCKARIEPVKRIIETAFEFGIHIELTTLIIPDENDSEDEFKKLVSYISSLSKSIPLHISRYFPRYKLRQKPTDPKLLLRFHNLAKDKLDFVYTGNIITHNKSNTFCPNCGSLIIKRNGYSVENRMTIPGKCPNCGTIIYGYYGATV